ncbi:Cupredoxins domain-containing protein, partial [Dioscorea alata]
MAGVHTHLIFVSGLMACIFSLSMAATEHTVGEDFGWQIPQTKSFYQDWADARTFTVGDKLTFPHSTSVHSVVEVTKSDFDACRQTEVIGMYYMGPTVLELTEPGMHYYFCGVGMHCEAGQKFRINV